MLEHRPIVCVSGYRDEALLADCAASIRALGWPIAYADGAYPLFLRRGEPWSSDRSATFAALGGPPALWMDAPRDAPWPSEAAKKAALLAAVDGSPIDGGWTLWLDCDERLEAPLGPGPVEVALAGLPGDVGLVRRWRPDHDPAPGGFLLPLLLRRGAGLTFRPPRDFDVFLGDSRAAWPGMEPGEGAGAAEVPVELLRVRHERRLRTMDRHNRNGEYQRRRRAAHPREHESY